jgi:putative oxidoreductase
MAQVEEMKKTSNIQHRTPKAFASRLSNAQLQTQKNFDVRCWMFSVGCFLRPMDFLRGNIALRIVDVIVGGIFIYAGVIKVWDPIGFANDIDNYKIVPWAVGVRLAFYLPWLEILCGLALVTRRLYRGGLSILTTLVSIFIVASIVAKARGLDITCGCFGHASKNFSFAGHLALDFGLLISLVLLLRSSWRISIHGTGGTRAVASQE